jgi:hypothetical protein
MTLAEKIEKLFEMVAQAYFYKVGDRVNMRNSDHPTLVYEVVGIADDGGLTLKDEVTGKIIKISEEEAGSLDIQKAREVKHHGIFS